MFRQPSKWTISFLLYLSIGFISSAQEIRVDEIHLLNGNIIRGHILDQSDTNLVRIETLCSNVLHFEKAEILFMELNTKRAVDNLDPYQGIDGSGYFNVTDFGLLIGSGNNEQNRILSFTTVHGYAFIPYLFTGVGSGVELFEQATIPVFSDIRWHFYNRKISPFINFRCGYAFPLQDPESYWDFTFDTRGGMLWSAGMGTAIQMNSGNACTINVLYRYQGIKTLRTIEWTGYTSELLKKYNRFEIRFGFMFN